MVLSHPVGRSTSNDGAGISEFWMGFPESGHHQYCSVRLIDVPGLTWRFGSGPFVESTGRNQTATMPEGISKRRFGVQGFRACVDQTGSHPRVCSPGWEEAPSEHADLTFVILGGGGDRMGWRNVVVGKPDGRFHQVRNLGLQHLGYLPHVARYIKSSAHPAGSGDR